MKLVLRFLQWICYMPVPVVISIIKYPLAPILVLFFSTSDKRHLTACQWMETIDSDLSGDEGWNQIHLWGSDPLAWYNRTRWLYRNGGGRVSFEQIGCEYDQSWVDVQPNGMNVGGFCSMPNGFWQYRKRFLIAGRYFEPFLGWGLFGPSHGRCKYELSIRYRKNPT